MDKKETLCSLKNALVEFKESYNRLSYLCSVSDFDLNDYISNDYYPFEKSLDELSINDWVNDAEEKINTVLKAMIPNIEVGMYVHDIYRREWYEVKKIEGDTIFMFTPPYHYRKLNSNDFIELYNASPLNKALK